jgi:hypothetical protein
MQEPERIYAKAEKQGEVSQKATKIDCIIILSSKRGLKMKDALKKIVTGLFTVKSIVTIMLTAVFSVLSYKGVISGDQFLTIFTVVISFYFGTQTQKIEDKINSPKSEGK